MRILAVVTTLFAVGCYNPDIQSGTLHCAAGGICPDGMYCAADGLCYANGEAPPADMAGGSCPVGTHDCGGRCVDGKGLDACGPGCEVCTAGANAVATCDGQTCGTACDANSHMCSGACVANDDVNSCGGSCTPCDVPTGGSATCDGVACGGACPPGLRLCSGVCIDENTTCSGMCPVGRHDCSGMCAADDSVNSCGTGCGTCPVPANAVAATCSSGSCGVVCDVAFHECSGQCKSDSDATACGAGCNVCPVPTNGSAVCSSGSCDIACDSGYHACAGACVADDDITACGASCTACSVPSNGAAICSGGVCGVTCDPGYHDCNSACASDMDPATCGTSCTPCTAPTGGTATCDGASCGGSCPINQQLCLGACIPIGDSCAGSCPPGQHDCSGLCATDTNVNSCGTQCSPCPGPTNGNGAATCDGTSCGIQCNSNYILCGTQCIAKTSTSNCGGCGQICNTTHASSATCDGTTCSYASCNVGFANCNNAAPDLDGCETAIFNNDAHCGGCNTSCAQTGGTNTCNGAGVCVPSCDSTHADCDSSRTNGCETSIINNDSNCGGCNVACQAAGGTNTCNGSGVCVPACDGTHADCDSSRTNGCETTIVSNNADCGGCNIACQQAGGTNSCNASGVCVPTCDSTHADCDSSRTNGCETSIVSNNADCGGCNVVCQQAGGTNTCNGSGVCVPACDSTHADCDSSRTNGCETSIVSNNADCGGCNVVCQQAGGTNTCNGSGVCVPACDSTHGDCDSSRTNGCETATDTSTTSCGACGRICLSTNVSGTITCAAGLCDTTACSSGYANCNKPAAPAGDDGCETHTSVDVDNCGACNHVCPAPGSGGSARNCVSGTCIPTCDGSHHVCNEVCVSNTDTATCGASCTPCAAPPANATATCNGTSCGYACNAGYTDDGAGGCAIAPPRPIWPPSASFVTSLTPTLEWALPGGTVTTAHVQICDDHACATVSQEYDVTASSGLVPTALSPGVHYWRMYGKAGTTVGTIASAVWQFVVPTATATAVTTTAHGTYADFNADGRVDLAVSENHPSYVGIFLGANTAQGINTTPQAQLSSGANTPSLSVGDFNGDGYVDLLVSGTDGVKVFRGGSSGLSTTAAVTFGVALAVAVGDVNHDGYADAIIGGNLYEGSATGLVIGPAYSFPTLAPLAQPPNYNQASSSTVAAAGDVDGDGYEDVLYAERLWDTVTSNGTAQAWVIRGGSDGLQPSPISLTGTTANQSIAVASAGDVNGDGYADVMVGQWSFSVASAVSIFHGGTPAASWSSTITISGAAASNLGAALVAAGDVDGDGYGDILLGASGLGYAYVYKGSLGGITTPAATTLGSGDTSGQYGASVAAGDFNGDGLPDAVVGSPNGYPGLNNPKGGADLYLNSGSAISTTSAASLVGSDYTTYGSAFATSLCARN